MQSDSSKKHGNGTGLGLCISKEFALLMGGDILVDSILGKGSNFQLHLPVKVASVPLIASNQTANISPQAPLRVSSYEKRVISDNPSRHSPLIKVSASKMSKEWRESLRIAAITGSDKKMTDLVNQIPIAFKDLSRIITYWINEFKFDEIITLIEQVEQ